MAPSAPARLRQRRLDRVDRVGLGEDRTLGMRRRRRLDMAAGGEDERGPLSASRSATGQTCSPSFSWTSMMATSNPPWPDPGERVLDGIAGAGDRVAERIEEILEHHRDQRLVFDDEDGARGHEGSLKA